MFTLDNRACILPCDTKAIPTESETPPSETVVQPDNEDNTVTTEEAEKEKEEKEAKKDPKKKQEEKEEKKEVGVEAGSPESTCNLTLKAEQFAGLKTGEKTRVQCPAGCKEMEEAAVFGPAPADEKLQLEEAYDDKSSICRAGIHSGRIPSDGGDVYIFVENGREK